MFAAVVGAELQGTVAIDDITVYLTGCPPPQPPTTTAPYQTHPDQKPTKGDCDFENG